MQVLSWLTPKVFEYTKKFLKTVAAILLCLYKSTHTGFTRNQFQRRHVAIYYFSKEFHTILGNVSIHKKNRI
jgi:hypothetical protein